MPVCHGLQLSYEDNVPLFQGHICPEKKTHPVICPIWKELPICQLYSTSTACFHQLRGLGCSRFSRHIWHPVDGRSIERPPAMPHIAKLGWKKGGKKRKIKKEKETPTSYLSPYFSPFFSTNKVDHGTKAGNQGAARLVRTVCSSRRRYCHVGQTNGTKEKYQS